MTETTQTDVDWRPTHRPMNVSEHRMFGVLRSLGFDAVPQARIGEFTVDFLLPAFRVVIEADGKPYHSDTARNQYDRARDLWLQAAGYVTIHVWTDNLFRPEGPGKIRRHILLRLYRERGVRLPMARQFYARLNERAERLALRTDERPPAPRPAEPLAPA